MLLSGRFVWFAWRLRRDMRLAMPTFRYSIIYLFGLFALLLADHYLAALAHASAFWSPLAGAFGSIG
jgi:protoheme IX farnesyltransferase